MNVLVTGGSGLVGRWIVDDLESDHAVTNLDVRPPQRAGTPFIAHDLLKMDGLVDLLRGFDAVVHCAAIPSPLNDPPDVVYRHNVVSTDNILEACAAAGIARFVFISSESTLGFAFGPRDLFPAYLPIDELHPLRASDPYGLSKLTGEILCQGMTRRTGMTTVCLRPPWIWVPEEKEIQIYRSLRKNHGDWAKTLWAFIDVRDLAEAVRRSLRQPIAGNHAVLFVSAESNWTGLPSRELASQFFPQGVTVKEDWKGADSFLSGGKAKDVLGFVPRRGVQDVIGSGEGS